MARRRPARTLADVPVRALRAALATLPTLHAVALAFGVSDNAVRYWCRKLALAPATPPRRGLALQAQLLRTLTSCAQGATVAELVAALHQSPSACNYGLRVLERRGHITRALARPWTRGRRRLRWHAIR